MTEGIDSTIRDYKKDYRSVSSGQTVSPIDSGELDALLKRGLNFKPYIRALRRRALIVVGIAAAFAGYAIYQSSKSGEIYRSEFQILVEPVSRQGSFSDPSALTRSPETGTPELTTGLDYPTQLEVLQGPGLLNQIVETVKREYPTFSYGRLRRGLSVERIGDTRFTQTKLIRVAYSDANPDRVEVVLDAAANQYLRYSLEDRRTQFSEGLSFIEQQLPRLQERVRFFQDQRQQLQQEYEFVNPELQGEFVTAQINDVTSLQMQTSRELQEQRAFYRSLQNQLQLTPDEAIAASTLSQDPRYQQLVTEIQQVDQEIARESVRFSSASPVLQALNQRHENLRNLLDRQIQEILGQDLNLADGNAQVLAFQNDVRVTLIQQLVETANHVQLLEARNQAISQDRQQLTLQFDNLPVVIRRYNEIDQQLGLSNRTLEQLLSQRELLAVEAAQNEVPWEIISEAKLPRDVNGNPIPIPRSIKELIAVVGLGVLAGVASAILIDRSKNIFYTTEDIQDNVELPILGIVPFYEGEQALKHFEFPDNGQAAYPSNDFVHDSSSLSESRKILFSEAFSSLYAGLQFAVSKHAIRSLVITSAEPGDGKSMVASHFADLFASVGKKTLLVDANFHRPSSRWRYGLSGEKGLVDIIEDALPADGLIRRISPTSNLYVLPAGEHKLASSRLLASNNMQTLMTSLEKEFDIVIYDTPHLLGLTDAHFLTSKADGMLMVAALEKTKRDVFMQVLNEIKTYELPLLGIVANHVKEKSKVTYGYRNVVFRKKPVALVEN